MQLEGTVITEYYILFLPFSNLLICATGRSAWGSPAADLAAARELIEKCGYGRRKEELEDAERAIGGGGA